MADSRGSTSNRTCDSNSSTSSSNRRDIYGSSPGKCADGSARENTNGDTPLLSGWCCRSSSSDLASSDMSIRGSIQYVSNRAERGACSHPHGSASADVAHSSRTICDGSHSSSNSNSSGSCGCVTEGTGGDVGSSITGPRLLGSLSLVKDGSRVRNFYYGREDSTKPASAELPPQEDSPTIITCRPSEGRHVWLAALMVLLLGTLNQVLGKIRAKALGRFDSVVALSNAILYTVVYFILMVLLWTKHISRDNISFIWTTVEKADGAATVNLQTATTASSSSATSSAPTAETEEQQRHHGLRAPLLRAQQGPPGPPQQPRDEAIDGGPLDAGPAPGSAAAAGSSFSIRRKRRGGAWRWLLVTGCCDAFGNILGFLAQPYVPGPYYVLALQAVVPFSCLCSMVLLKRRYTCYHVMALALVIGGVVLPVMHTDRHAAVVPVSTSAMGTMGGEQRVVKEGRRRNSIEGRERDARGDRAIQRDAVSQRRGQNSAETKGENAAAAAEKISFTDVLFLHIVGKVDTATAAAPERGHRDDPEAMRHASARQKGEDALPVFSDASVPVIVPRKTVDEVVATGGGAPYSLLRETPLEREQEMAAKHQTEPSMATSWSSSTAIVANDNATNTSHTNRSSGGAVYNTAATAHAACVNCASHGRKSVDVVGSMSAGTSGQRIAGEAAEEKEPGDGEHDLLGNTVSKRGSVTPLLSDSGEKGADVSDASVNMACASSALHCVQFQRPRGTSLKAENGRSDVHTGKRQQRKERVAIRVSQSLRGVSASSDGVVRSIPASLVEKGEPQGVQRFGCKERARANARRQREQVGVEVPVESLDDAGTVRHARTSHDGSGTAPYPNRGPAADAHSVNRSEAGIREENATGTGRLSLFLRYLSAASPTVQSRERDGIKRKSFSERGGTERRSSSFLRVATKFVEPAFPSADEAEFAAVFAAATQAELQPSSQWDVKGTPAGETESQDVTVWLYFCIAALSAFPTALSFAVKEKLLQLYKQLHESTAAVAEGLAAGLRLRQQQEAAGGVRAVGVATLVPSDYISATDTDTAGEDHSGWGSCRSSEESLLQIPSSACLPSNIKKYLRLYSGDAQGSSSIPAATVPTDAGRSEAFVYSGHGSRREAGGGVQTLTHNTTVAWWNSGWCNPSDPSTSRITEGTSFPARNWQEPLVDKAEVYSAGRKSPGRRELLERIASKCIEEEEGAEAAVLMGGGVVLPSPSEALDHYSQDSPASGPGKLTAVPSSSLPAGGGWSQTHVSRQARRLHVIVVCAYCSAFQLIWVLAALPLSSWLGQTNDQSIREFAADALDCFSGSSAIKGRNGSASLLFVHSDADDVDLCPYALRAYAVYAVINIIFNISLIGFAAAASSLLCFVTLKATLPLGILAYALIPWPLLEQHDVTVDTSVLVCLALILSGIVWFHWESLRWRRLYGSSSVTSNPPCCWPLRPQLLLRCAKRGLRYALSSLQMLRTWMETARRRRDPQPADRSRP